MVFTLARTIKVESTEYELKACIEDREDSKAQTNTLGFTMMGAYRN